MKKNIIYLAGGCFWGTQKYFDQFPGVLETEVGYANGPTESPSYQEVCKSSGHAETVRVVYDEDSLSLENLLRFYFKSINPVSVNRQGNDYGIQYRTGIYYTDNEQKKIAESVMQDIQKNYSSPIAVELLPIDCFYPAEEYHQKYLEKNPGGYCHLPESLFHLTEH